MAESIFEIALAKAKTSIWRNNRLVGFFTLLLIPLVLSLWTDRAEAPAVSPGLFWVVVIALASVQIFAFAFLDKRASDEVPDLVFAHHELEEQLGREQVLNDELSEALEASVAAQTVARFWATMQAHLALFYKRGGSLEDACSRIIQPLLYQADKLFGWTYSDIWSVAVFRWNEASGMLEPVFCRRSDSHPSSDDPRSWRDGEGHCGTAFMSQSTLFTNDLAEPSTLNRVKPTPDNTRPYDAAIYRSFATVPLTINDPDGDLRLGVVALTSDHVGRFSESNVAVVEQLGDVLAQALWLKSLAGDL